MLPALCMLLLAALCGVRSSSPTIIDTRINGLVCDPSGDSNVHRTTTGRCSRATCGESLEIREEAGEEVDGYVCQKVCCSQFAHDGFVDPAGTSCNQNCALLEPVSTSRGYRTSSAGSSSSESSSGPASIVPGAQLLLNDACMPFHLCGAICSLDTLD